jgi:hypothetical protein
MGGSVVGPDDDAGTWRDEGTGEGCMERLHHKTAPLQLARLLTSRRKEGKAHVKYRSWRGPYRLGAGEVETTRARWPGGGVIRRLSDRAGIWNGLSWPVELVLEPETSG